MKLLRFSQGNDVAHLGVLLNREVVDLGIRDPLELVDRLKDSGLPEDKFLATSFDIGSLPRLNYTDIDNLPPRQLHILSPLIPPEVWGCGVTYLQSRTARETETVSKGIYERVYNAERPEVFFKATPNRCVGPNQAVCIREDSTWSVPEAELAFVIGRDGEIIGFTAGNDMSARDIEGENPLYLPQAKIYAGCCSIGPLLVTESSIGDPQQLGIELSIVRDESTVFRGRTNTKLMKRKVSELWSFLTRNNPVPPGSVCLTGTGIVPPDDFSLREKDLIEIQLQNVGVLRNTVRKLGHVLDPSTI